MHNKNKVSNEKTLGIASLVLGIISIILGPFTFIPGIICGHLSRRKNKTNNIALAGLILNYFLLIITVLLILLYISFEKLK